MIRGPLLHLLLVLVPFVIYWIFIRFVRTKEEQTGGHWNAALYVWLLIAGLSLSAASMILLGLLSGDREGEYVPPQIIDGELVPGHRNKP